MAEDISRRELFGSLKSSFKEQEKIILRPPYYSDEDDFHKYCIDCIDKPCINICEEQIIKLSSDGTVELDLNQSGCTYCDECAEVCKSDVLKIENSANINAKIEIDILKCLSWHQTMCFSCKDPCLDDAIKFLGMFRPEIDDNLCTSCGFCVKVCPTDAITMEIIKDKEILENGC